MDRIVSARVEAQRWYERRPRAVPMGTFLLAMAITVLAVVAIERTNREREGEQMQAVARGVGSALERRATAHVAYLRAGAILLSMPGGMSESGFQDFARDVRADEDGPLAETMSYAPWLQVAGLDGFATRRRAEGAPGFAIHPAPAPTDRWAAPVTWLGTVSPDILPALGYNLYGEPARRAALDAARVRRGPAITGRTQLRLWSGHPEGPAFVIVMPVFARAAARPLIGFIATPFDTNTFLAAALKLGQAQGFGVRPFAIRLYDGEVAPTHLLAQTGPAGGGRNVSVPVKLVGRGFRLVVETDNVAALSPLSITVLLFGTLLAVLSAVMARLVTSQAAVDRASLDWLREQASIRASLTRELNHRVKNTLANVLSIIALTRHRTTTLDEFADGLNGRIRALSATHDLLTSSDWGPTPIIALVAAELAPYAQGYEKAVDLDGPPIELAPNDALLLGLAIHELATNASKYGALSVAGGRVEVRWHRVGPDRVRLHWQESGGPPVPLARRRGFGTELLERIVAHELGHAVEMDFAEAGLGCVLMVPVRLPAAFRIRAKEAAGPD